MNTSLLALMAALPLCVFAQNEEHKTPQQIQQELDEDEALFQRALKMFNPWYTGPLLTPSASMMPPGYGNIQSYLFLTDNYAQFDEDRHSHDLPSSNINFNPSVSLVLGVTDSVDALIVLQADANWQHHQSGGGMGDMPIGIGFIVTPQTLNIPKIKFSIQETFPIGPYQHLNHNGLGLGGTGSGSWQTQFSLAFGKLMFWTYKHPVNFRLYFGYNVALPVKVKGFNSYGGGFGTDGTVHPGNTFKADFAIEFSMTQNWVLATDVVYTAQSSTTFSSGHIGTTTSGGSTPASIGKGYSDSLSLAPAIEYNWNENLGVVGGFWFPVYGRNSSNFLSGIFSVSWTFGPI